LKNFKFTPTSTNKIALKSINQWFDIKNSIHDTHNQFLTKHIFDDLETLLNQKDFDVSKSNIKINQVKKMIVTDIKKINQISSNTNTKTSDHDKQEIKKLIPILQDIFKKLSTKYNLRYDENSAEINKKNEASRLHNKKVNATRKQQNEQFKKELLAGNLDSTRFKFTSNIKK